MKIIYKLRKTPLIPTKIEHLVGRIYSSKSSDKRVWRYIVEDRKLYFEILTDKNGNKLTKEELILISRPENTLNSIRNGSFKEVTNEDSNET